MWGGGGLEASHTACDGTATDWCRQIELHLAKVEDASAELGLECIFSAVADQIRPGVLGRGAVVADLMMVRMADDIPVVECAGLCCCRAAVVGSDKLGYAEDIPAFFIYLFI